MIILALSSLSLLIWLVLLLGRGGFWRVSITLPTTSSPPCRVTAIVPARDEADVIAESISSLANQQFNGDLQLIVVDDTSTDGTAPLARNAGASVIQGAPLAEGWTGKLWALQQGVSAAESLRPDFFLFTDADIRHDPYNLAKLVALAESKNLDLVSHMVKLHCSSWAEKFTIPAFVFFFFKLYPPSWVASPESNAAGAAGGCVLIRPSTLTKIGGLSAIRSELIDDCSLARAVKRIGGRLWLGLTPGTESIRAYAGLADIERMISRSAFRQLNHSTLLLVGAVIGLIVTYLLPPLLACSGSYMALAAWLIMTICYLPMVRFYRLNPLWALSLPLTACFYLFATIHSALNYWTGRGGVWKGRTQDQPIN